MTAYTLVGSSKTSAIGWDDPTVWSGGVVPNGPDAAVTIPLITQNPNTSSASVYAPTITIKAGETFGIGSLDIAAASKSVVAVNGALQVGTGGTVFVSGSGTITAGSVASLSESTFSGSVLAGSVQTASLDGGNDPSRTVVSGAVDTLVRLGSQATLVAGSIRTVGSITGGYLSTCAPTVVSVTGGPGSFGGLTGTALTSGSYGDYEPGILDLDIGAVVDTDNATITLANIFTRDPATGAYVALSNSLTTVGAAGTLIASGTSNTLTQPLSVSGTLLLSKTSSGGDPGRWRR